MIVKDSHNNPNRTKLPKVQRESTVGTKSYIRKLLHAAIRGQRMSSHGNGYPNWASEVPTIKM